MTVRLISSATVVVATGLLAVLTGLAGPDAGAADAIYQCRSESGKPAFVTNPSGLKDCRPIDVKVDEPNPEDVARALEEKRRKDEEARLNEEQEREERLTRAREAEAEAATRRARVAEEELRLLKQRQSEQNQENDTSYWPYPITIPRYPHHPQKPHHPPKQDGQQGGGKSDPTGLPRGRPW